LKELIIILNDKINALKIFNVSLGLAEKVEREEKSYPVINKGFGEYEKIDLDKYGSISYWRKNGEINMVSQDNKAGLGQEYRKDIPLKLVGYIKNEKTDQYFTDKVIDSIISAVTSNNVEVRKSFKAKRVQITANRAVTDKIEVEKTEYENKIDFVRLQDYYFSIDFTVSVFTNSQCYVSICNDC
jgi:hypothetical protein